MCILMLIPLALPLRRIVALVIVCLLSFQLQDINASSTSTASYYKILGVSPTASSEEITKAYRKEAVKWHPDKNVDKVKAEKYFKRLSVAYETLKDQNKRASYDDSLRQGGASSFRSSASQYEKWPPPTSAGEAPRYTSHQYKYYPDRMRTPNPTELRYRFGLGTRRGEFEMPAPQWQTLYTKLECTLEELHSGGPKEIRFSDSFWERSKQAMRSGLWMDISAIGITAALPFIRSLFMSILVFGFSVHKVTPQLPKEPVFVNIPAGVRDGETLHVNMVPEIVIDILEVPHKTFERRGDDLVIRQQISKQNALEGGDIEIPTLNQGNVAINIRKGEVSAGYVKTVRGMGMPIRDTNKRGKLLIVFSVK